MSTENQKFCDIGGGASLVWDIVDGVNVVYIETAGVEDDIILTTEDYSKARATYEDNADYLGV